MFRFFCACLVQAGYFIRCAFSGLHVMDIINVASRFFHLQQYCYHSKVAIIARKHGKDVRDRDVLYGRSRTNSLAAERVL